MKGLPGQHGLCLLLVLAALLLGEPPASAGAAVPPGPPRDARAGILDASLVVIVKAETPDAFKIEQVLLGKGPPGGKIRLAGFKLIDHPDEGPDVTHPITPSTRILLLLKHPDKDQQEWEITQDGNCFFWVGDPLAVDQLRKIGLGAIQLRTAWEAARNTRDKTQRVKALWPYLWNEERYFFKATLDELQKAGDVTGDYVAAAFDSLTSLQRKMLLSYLGTFGGRALHEAVIAYVKKAQVSGGSPSTAPDAPLRPGLPGEGPGRRVGPSARDSLPDADSGVSDGLEGLISFKDPADLPFIRDLALSAVVKGHRQTCYSALSAFRLMPAGENLQVIDEIRKASVGQVPMVVAIIVVRTLSTHKYARTVPLLAPYLDDKAVAAETQRYLSEIVGKDLGKGKQAWLDWYAAQGKPS
jgi:hypothetical protein